MSGSTGATNSAAATAKQQNMLARAAVLSAAVPMRQQIFATTITPSNGNVINISPRNVGLVRGFLVKVVATVHNSGGAAITPTTLNASNLLSQIVFNDLNNYTRISTTGWHLNFLNSAKAKHPFMAAFTGDLPMGYGNGWAPFAAPASIAASANGTVECWYWIPLAYHKRDLRGAIYANVVNATMNLQLTVNPNPVVASANDATLAVYTGASAAGSITSCTVTVFQDFLDQLPVGNGGLILPMRDLATIYDIKNTTLQGLVQNQSFPVAYANFREFLSTMVIFDNGGTLNYGTDVNYMALQSANFLNLWQVTPDVLAIEARARLHSDMPVGCYYLDHRDKAISTVQYGNMELIVNPSTVNANAVLMVGFEAMGVANTIIPAGSLPAS